MSESRRIRRKKVKLLKKKLQERLSSVQESLSRIPETCNKCDEKFIKEGKECLNWKINVSSSAGITVTCPECVKKIMSI